MERIDLENLSEEIHAKIKEKKINSYKLIKCTGLHWNVLPRIKKGNITARKLNELIDYLSEE